MISCPIMCHDRNHNGDDYPDRPCGNPFCWKYGDGAPLEKPVRVLRCQCPLGTFVEDEVI